MTDEITGARVARKCCFLCIYAANQVEARSSQTIICDLSDKIWLYINNDGAGIRCTVACLFVLEHVYQAIFPASNRTCGASSLCFLSHANLVFLDATRDYATIIRGNFNPMKLLSAQGYARSCLMKHFVDNYLFRVLLESILSAV